MNRELLYHQFIKNNFIKVSQSGFDYIDVIYASPEQLYGVAVFLNEELLKRTWEKTAYELAVKIQTRLTGQLKDLRWDIYLILLVTESNVKIATRKIIENDRHFFRKIILTPDDQPFIEHLPFLLDLKRVDEGSIMFGDTEFLQQLKIHLSKETNERLGNNFFEGNSTENDLHQLLVEPHIKGCEKA